MQQTWAVFANGAQVRVFWVDGEPWFDAVGVCEAMGLRNIEKAIRRLDDDEKGLVTVDNAGGREEILVVRESGMLRLALAGREPHARAFQRWVVREVLPLAIRGQRPNALEEQLRLEKVSLLVEILAAYQDRLSNDGIEHLAKTIANLLT
ncbi:BRO-N domain-containing protein [Alicyclobacillus sendaiensis]|uniref:BRO-N domain-containing protein n=1 Tax=Alicyclobacillus sendaiensis TaxID=192387 RepID=UPI0007866FBF|nr:Bro-N domain-containing protein [Alicyclobacillus sendaiensis]